MRDVFRASILSVLLGIAITVVPIVALLVGRLSFVFVAISVVFACVGPYVAISFATTWVKVADDHVEVGRFGRRHLFESRDSTVTFHSYAEGFLTTGTLVEIRDSEKRMCFQLSAFRRRDHRMLKELLKSTLRTAL